MTLRKDCPTCIGYALVDADLAEHEVEAGASFDDQYQVITDFRDAHVGGQPEYVRNRQQA